jgi:hypothetical protein
MRAWQIGDRVWVNPTGRSDWTQGTVTAVDEEGHPRGVRVLLDHPVRGCDDCYASHGELKPCGTAQLGR